jgi:hypothetical protein
MIKQKNFIMKISKTGIEKLKVKNYTGIKFCKILDQKKKCTIIEMSKKE